MDTQSVVQLPLQDLVAIHRQTCGLHPADSPNCNVHTLKGEACRYKGRNGIEPDGTIPGRLPVCGMHRPFAPSSARCKAMLPCGFECGRLFKWSPGEVRLCPDHDDMSQPCYFMIIPAELRMKIYQQLFLEPQTDKRPYSDSRSSKGNRTSIFRVNRKINEEATSVFYGYPKYTIEVGPDQVHMAGDLWKWRYYKNLLIEKARLSKSENSSDRPVALLGAPSHPFLKCTTINLPMGVANFSKMRTFHIHIHLNHPQKKGQARSNSANVSLQYTWEREMKDSYHMVADNLQKLEVFLKLVKPNIHTLSISIQIDYNFTGKLSDCLRYPVHALRWLSRLRSVTYVSVETVEWGNETFSVLPHVNYQPSPSRPTLIPLNTNQVPKEEMKKYNTFRAKIAIWESLVSTIDKCATNTRIMNAYWRLENLLWIFQTAGVRQFRENDDTLPDLLYKARCALHNDDIVGMNDAAIEAVKYWSNHIDMERDLRRWAWKEFLMVNTLTAPNTPSTLGELLEMLKDAGISSSVLPQIPLRLAGASAP
ncbi:hypothetical protein H112_07127 [Trichophyton rubrum D6]|uniref:Probable treble clef zinc finger fungi domain-containing protein n=2 Tax=Trichophyton rubrum TaxID=5551 RepID=A0A178EZJ6_TRIRU|nr:hypothetical protein H100_07151 [Trichophyton rubrum MR850]EZF38631.1 hypothetical protein H102_07112 [Trichophyton rubrum CBS 100081]EZF49339.1 hypothetical protein H103_07135 [Trichophyton rubrum CBS 288.86]EZF59883.1 hypothetical protein H104_07089 [Trichophyton rubrum CBS 289.86]EZF81231.1 hypothetical protein H110_07135 [Trichophyton rubrum MR1448]EZG13417.1 hypothetical protein H107_07295 [Trichophyton rubrum CBS 202.88]KDB30271.1 hypothetical protein H112_07127 [Trichophyton rubrum 